MKLSMRLGVVAFTVLLSHTLPVMAVEPVEKTLSMPADGLVFVENMAGEIEIESWDKAEAWVRVEPGRGVEAIEADETSAGIRVVVHYNDSYRRSGDSTVSLKVPARADIQAQGVSADFSLQGNRGRSVEVETVSGDISVEAETESIDLNTVSGDVEFEGGASRVRAESVSGDLELLGVEGEINANTVSGDAIIQAGKVQRLSVDTVSGDARMQLSLANDGRIQINAMSGDIILELPSDQAARMTAQTFSGEIRSDFGNASASGNGSGGTLQHREGSNDAVIRTETFSGDIYIHAD